MREPLPHDFGTAARGRVMRTAEGKFVAEVKTGWIFKRWEPLSTLVIGSIPPRRAPVRFESAEQARAALVDYLDVKRGPMFVEYVP